MGASETKNRSILTGMMSSIIAFIQLNITVNKPYYVNMLYEYIVPCQLLKMWLMTSKQRL